MRPWMRRAAWALGVLVALPPAVFLAVAYWGAQRADYGWRPSIERPVQAPGAVRVAVDEGHNNASSAGFAGRYFPFARLLRADGYVVSRLDARFDAAALAGTRVLVIANASGASKPQWFGMNLPFVGAEAEDERRGAPAFTEAEIQALLDWVRAGGGLLLVADHAPFGSAAAPLAQAFGVRLHQGFTELESEESSDPLLFSRANGRLGAHPVFEGPAGAVQRVMSFTGESLDGPPGATVLLRLPPEAREWSEGANGQMQPGPAGAAQGVAFGLGRGRVVVLGEAAMLTAQVAARKPFGMNTPDNDNALFARNLVAWLAQQP